MGALSRLSPAWRKRLELGAGGGLLLGWAVLWWVTAPPPVPFFSRLPRQWQSSEAWLQDRDGRLLDEIRVDYDVRRLGWTRLDDVSPALRQAVIGAEDHRFLSHGGVDWLALGNATRGQLAGRRGRGCGRGERSGARTGPA